MLKLSAIFKFINTHRDALSRCCRAGVTGQWPLVFLGNEHQDVEEQLYIFSEGKCPLTAYVYIVLGIY